jgi:hypothetical protein
MWIWSSELLKKGKVKEFLNYQLSDDNTAEGGIGKSVYTLDDYVSEIAGYNDDDGEEVTYEDLLNFVIKDINPFLKDSGILPVEMPLVRERKQYACMIAYYIGYYAHMDPKDYPHSLSIEQFHKSFYEPDSLPVMDLCVSLAESYDFKMIYENNQWVIDTEFARSEAENFAQAILAGQISID